jgi:hypothetical protein
MGKIGEGHFWAWLRQGLREVQAWFYPESNIAQPPEYGLFGHPTPGEVGEARREDGRYHDLHDERSESVLGGRLREAKGRSDRDDRDQDRGLDR